MFGIDSLAATPGGRFGARRLAGTTCLVLAAGLGTAAGQDVDSTPLVREERGVYTVAATFGVSGAPATALATLTDYEHIPRFMPAVRTSRILERRDGEWIVEQEAVATFMWFSKRVHLMLDVREESGTIHFADRCGNSFERYEGTWVVTDRGGRTIVEYRLSAKPSFEVPAFVLKRLLKRDASQMIGQLQAEIAARTAGR
jgi:ribosome-associated toxin RatA of RatAB toxin-antitoxin module